MRLELSELPAHARSKASMEKLLQRFGVVVSFAVLPWAVEVTLLCDDPGLISVEKKVLLDNFFYLMGLTC